MTTLITDQPHRFGTKRVLPVIGETEISATGTIQVEDWKVEEFLETDCGFEVVEQQEQPTTTTTKAIQITTTTTTISTIAPQVESNNIKPQTTENVVVETTTEPAKVAENTLSSLTVVQLQELAKEFPAEEWKSKTKKQDLIDYLTSKLPK